MLVAGVFKSQIPIFKEEDPGGDPEEEREEEVLGRRRRRKFRRPKYRGWGINLMMID